MFIVVMTLFNIFSFQPAHIIQNLKTCFVFLTRSQVPDVVRQLKHLNNNHQTKKESVITRQTRIIEN
ncbi:MAG: hypothetical protein DRQ51_09010 [Gammaproteobacteria bacterium]|nr:MAG: hypothetical protein DRQ51_09010 [Gammaproteobacteria bacterium]